VQDIPRTVDHAPSKTIYTWKVDLEAVYQQMAANMIKAVCNLTDRIDSELAKRPLASLPLSLLLKKWTHICHKEQIAQAQCIRRKTHKGQCGLGGGGVQPKIAILFSPTTPIWNCVSAPGKPTRLPVPKMPAEYMYTSDSFSKSMQTLALKKSARS